MIFMLKILLQKIFLIANVSNEMKINWGKILVAEKRGKD